MYGWGVIKTLGIALYHFIMTYVDDFKYGWSKRYTPENLPERQGAYGRGVFTIQYPAERWTLPERARILPFLIQDQETGELRCTACGICAQACPAQCIWIERAQDPDTGRPLKQPSAYHIDISLCMSCGFCAEFCPFDAIKMDHDYEISSYTRPGFVGIEELTKPESHHAQIHPTAYAEEQASKAAKAK